jgi:tRNA A-37 threonylcarbamoyl transferase component Bud32
MKKTQGKRRLDAFGFRPGDVLAEKYEVVLKLGGGWEGEVYMLRERSTGIDRAAKFFFPHRNERGKTARIYARKLHKLRHCPVLTQYHTQETIEFHDHQITFLISEFVEGELLKAFLKRQPGGRLTPFEGLHLLYTLAAGVERIHHLREYHGDLHAENVILRRRGIWFDCKLIDMFHWGGPKPDNMQEDVCDLVRIFYDAVGGQARYARQPEIVKDICCGLKRGLILKKYRTAGQLREYLEIVSWE